MFATAGRSPGWVVQHGKPTKLMHYRCSSPGRNSDQQGDLRVGGAMSTKYLVGGKTSKDHCGGRRLG